MWNLGVGKWVFVVSSSLIFKSVRNILCNRQNIINGRVNYSWSSKWRHGIIPGQRKQTKENVYCRCWDLWLKLHLGELVVYQIWNLSSLLFSEGPRNFWVLPSMFAFLKLGSGKWLKTGGTWGQWKEKM